MDLQTEELVKCVQRCRHWWCIDKKETEPEGQIFNLLADLHSEPHLLYGHELQVRNITVRLPIQKADMSCLCRVSGFTFQAMDIWKHAG